MLQGTLDDFSLTDVLWLLSSGHRTGKLEITRPDGRGDVFFRDGDVYYSESTIAKEPLGQRLIRAKALSEADLRTALEVHAKTGQRVGEILIAEGVVAVEQIEAAVRQQIEDAVVGLLPGDQGEFSWEAGIVANPDVRINVGVGDLIAEATTRLEELDVIKRKIPSMQAILAMSPAPPEGAVEINITPDEWRILVVLDGQKTIADVAARFQLSEFTAMRTFYGLVTHGLIEVIATAPDMPAEDAAPEPAVPAGPEAVTSSEPFPVLETAQKSDGFHEQSNADSVPTPESDGFLEQSNADSEPTPELPAVLENEMGARPHHEGGEDATLGIEDADEIDDAAAFAEAVLASIDDADEPAIVAADEAPDEWLGGPESSPVGDDVVLEPAEEEPSFEDIVGADQPAEAPEPEPPQAIPPTPTSEEATVDRVTAVRELAGLFGDDAKPTRPLLSSRDPEAPDQPIERRRVEDDEQVTKSLISRLISGVKGL